MNKKLVVSIAVLSATFLVTGCKDNVEVESFVNGEWKLARIQSRDVVIEGEELELSYKGDVIYTFNEDGTASVAISEQVIEGTWEGKGDTYVLTCNELDAEFKADGDTLVANPEGVLVVLERNVEQIPSEEIPNEEIPNEEEITEEVVEDTQESDEESTEE